MVHSQHCLCYNTMIIKEIIKEGHSVKKNQPKKKTNQKKAQ